MNNFTEAKNLYEQLGVHVEEALTKLNSFPVSMHCWQGDDVIGFDQGQSLSGGIQTTGHYPGKASTPQELMADIDEALKYIPGTKKLNLHASYALFEDGEHVDRDQLEPKHFKGWVEFAKARNLKLDFNPTIFSHPKAEGLTLASNDETIRTFWVDHCKACIRISEYFANELGGPVVMNIWIPDGLKDVPGSRFAPRQRYMQSLDEILSMDYDHEKVKVALESKVFGIGMESYTVGSGEMTFGYAIRHGLTPLMDNGHYHPTEMVSDKISSALLLAGELALHVTRPVRWDSDHVVLFDDETREICKEIVRCDGLDNVYLATDFFDASINRIAAWVIGLRNVQKAMLYALLEPTETVRKLQDEGDFTTLLALQEELKTMPFHEIWAEYCRRNKVEPGLAWLDSVKRYENEQLRKRGE
ncbi:L-rhamnose isomerase [uncultured Dubosiella sp.]|uniref:L-rhamnose isomerase n=1 Tax=uncultured Dubosiella sp. TaxID=1937011 RepID=UPI0025B3F252|nr:L-rhamnose isomerase [uncultured Dubosiella sp.]